MSQATAQETPVKVSVVVPVYNAADFIQTSITSMLAQTLPPGDLELIYVDDGSPDDSLERLRAAEAEIEHLRVLTIPNSGWPGRPRNVGTDAARGAYVMYVDQDDQLDPDALRRMYELGAANDADVVLGKVTSDFRGVHQDLYRRTLPRCTVHDTWLMGSQTPHKMLRTAFLREHDIRFAEGRRRLEDQLFISQAYLAARSCAIEADYVCYRYLRRPGGGNTGSKQVSAASYYGDLEDVLDVLDRYCPPGPERDRFYRRFLRTEMMSRLGGKRLAGASAKVRAERLEVIRELMERRFPTAVDDGLPPLLRQRAALTRAGSLSGLEELAGRVRRLAPGVEVSEVAMGDGALRLELTVEFRLDGAPLVLEDGDLLPTELTGPDADAGLRRLEADEELQADVVVRHRKSRDEWFLPGSWRLERLAAEGGTRLRWRGELTLDPRTVAGGHPLRYGYHDLVMRLVAFGLTRNQRVPVDPRTPELVLGRGRRQVRAYASKDATLSLRVRRKAASPAATSPATDGSGPSWHHRLRESRLGRSRPARLLWSRLRPLLRRRTG